MRTSVYAQNVLHADQANDSWTKLYNLVPEGVDILDIGCSSGNFGTELVKNKQCTVTGIDINEADLKLAAEHLTKVYKRNIEHDKVDDLGKYDVVIMADVIEHLVDPASALQKIRTTLLKPGGKLIFSVPNMANFATRLELLAGRFTYTEYGLLDETHLHYYDRVELEKAFARAGFQVETYNNTIRDVPRDAADQLLESLGLKAGKRFWEVAGHIDSITFQFIGVAVPGKAKHVDMSTKTPYDFVSKMIDDIRRDDRNYLLEVKQELKQELKTSEQARRSAEQELTQIKNSKGWRLLTRVYTIKHALTGSQQ